MFRLADRLAQFSPQQRAHIELRLEERRRSAPGGLIRPRAPAAGIAPPSFSQQRLWFVDQMETGSSFYNVAAAVRLEGPLRPQVLSRALDEVVRRHDALRTIFPDRGQGPVLAVEPAGRSELPEVDLRALSPGAGEREARRLASEELHRSFDLTRGPLLRCRLMHLAAREHLMTCSMHHIISDWWSVGVFVRELALLYHSYSENKPSPLAELPIQFQDFAAWQQDWLSGEVLESELAYWRRQLAGVPAFLKFPTDLPRPAVQSFRGDQHSFEVSAELCRGLEELGVAEGGTLFIVLLAAFQTLLHHYSGQEDLVTSAPISGRDHSESEGLIGCFVNTLIYRTDFAGNPSFRELLARVRLVVLEAYAHRHVPVDRIVKEIAPERNLSYSPLLQMSMNLVYHDPLERLEPKDLAISFFDLEAVYAQFELNLSLLRVARGLRGFLQYKTDLFERSTIELMVDQFRLLLERVVRSPDVPLREIRALLAQADEKRRRLAGRDLEQSYLSSLKEKRRRVVVIDWP